MRDFCHWLGISLFSPIRCVSVFWRNGKLYNSCRVRYVRDANAASMMGAWVTTPAAELVRRTQRARVFYTEYTFTLINSEVPYCFLNTYTTRNYKIRSYNRNVDDRYLLYLAWLLLVFCFVLTIHLWNVDKSIFENFPFDFLIALHRHRTSMSPAV